MDKKVRLPGMWPPMTLVYGDPWGGSIEFTGNALDTLWRYRQHKFFACERGGLLYARFLGVTTRVEVASGPLRARSAGRYHLDSHRPSEQRDVDKHFKMGLHFVGNWHTHPEKVPVPSKTDYRRIESNFYASVHELKGLIMVVVGLEAFPAGLSVIVQSANGPFAAPVLKPNR